LYCLPVRNLRFLDHSDILSYEEILKAVEAARDTGINKVRLTGGEPLIRKGFLKFVASLCQIGLDDVSITTNGVLLQEKAKEIFDSGVRRINVSLDTLKPLKYAKITGRDCFDDVWRGLQEVEAVGFNPIKVNVVAIRGLNDDELLRFAELSVKKAYHIRFIEYMPIGHDNQWRSEKYISSHEIKKKLQLVGPLEQVPRAVHDGPAKRYRLASAKGEIGFITPMSEHFCTSCNRLRLTAEGRLRPCLFSDEEVDIKTPLRNGCSQGDLKTLFEQTIASKPNQYHAVPLKRGEPFRPMSAIGG
jgi:cyclic pyranopterin phosphate synthase